MSSPSPCEWRVIIPDRLPPPADIEQAVFGPHAAILTPTVHQFREVPAAEWARADAVLAWHELQFDAAALATLARCKVIVRVGVGFDNVDLRGAGERGIVVSNVPDYGTNDVADHTIALLLALERGIVGFDAAARDGRWTWDGFGPLRRIGGLTLGVIGLGRIGTAVALRARAFGMRVVFYDPYKAAGYDKALGLERAEELGALLAQADVITLHVPLTDETHKLANREWFEAMKPGAVFLNTARGSCADADALWWALSSGRLRGAGLDVLPEEPPNRNHPLVAAWVAQRPEVVGRLLITPHAAFVNRQSFEEMRRKAAEEALRVLQGRPPRSCVNAMFLAPGVRPQVA